MRNTAHYLPFVLFAGFAVSLAFGLKNDPSLIPSVILDRPTPDFALSGLSDDEVGFKHDDLIGQVSLINVWASWCGVCGIEHPKLMRLSRDQTVPLYGIDWKDPPINGRQWLERYGNPYTLTGSDENGRLALDLGVTGAPETFVIDKTGRIRYKHIGAITDEVWNEKLAPMLAQLEAER